MMCYSGPRSIHGGLIMTEKQQDQTDSENQKPAPPGFHDTEGGGLYSPEGTYDPTPDSGYIGGRV